jgi:integrase
MMKGIIERGNSFQVKKRIGGQDITATFGGLKDAEAFSLSCEAAHRRGEPLPKPNGSAKDKRMVTLLSIYEEAVQVLWAANKTRATDEAAWLYVKWCGPKTPVEEAFSQDKINAYILFRRAEKKNSGCTINKKLSTIRMMAGLAWEKRLIPALPMMKSQGKANGRIRYFTREEEEQIFNLLTHWGAHKWRRLFEFMVDTGIRPNELRQLRWVWLKGGQAYLPPATTKSGKARSVPLTERARNALNGLGMANADRVGPFTWATKGRIRDIWERLRMHLPWMDKDTVPYCFRHTFASRLAMAGAPQTHIQLLMGHSTSAMTERYMHLAPATTKGLEKLLENFKDPT